MLVESSWSCLWLTSWFMVMSDVIVTTSMTKRDIILVGCKKSRTSARLPRSMEEVLVSGRSRSLKCLMNELQSPQSLTIDVELG